MSHPLTFGLSDDELPVFRHHNRIFQARDVPFITVGRYAEQPVLAGYVSETNRHLLAGSSSLIAHNLGRGRVIGFADDLLFRGYFLGSERLFANALFLAQAMDVSIDP